MAIRERGITYLRAGMISSSAAQLNSVQELANVRKKSLFHDQLQHINALTNTIQDTGST